MPDTIEQPDEEWRTIPDFEGCYEASSGGRIRSLDRELPFYQARWGVWTTRKYRGRELVTKIKPNGTGQFYGHVYVGDGKWRSTNRLVCAAFHGPAPTDRHEAAHLNGNSLDDMPTNLQWKLPVDNAEDKRAHGTMTEGSSNPMSVLSEAKIIHIFEDYLVDDCADVTAARYGVSASNIRKIIRRAAWRHVAVPTKTVKAAQARAKFNINRGLYRG